MRILEKLHLDKNKHLGGKNENSREAEKLHLDKNKHLGGKNENSREVTS